MTRKKQKLFFLESIEARMNIEQDKEPSPRCRNLHEPSVTRTTSSRLVSPRLLLLQAFFLSFFPSIFKTQIFFLASKASFGSTISALSLYYLLRVLCLCFCSFLRVLPESLKKTFGGLSRIFLAKVEAELFKLSLK